jgi:hypothetical protein
MGISPDEHGHDTVAEIGGDREFASVEGAITETCEAVIGGDPQCHEVPVGAGDDDLGRIDPHGTPFDRVTAVPSLARDYGANDGAGTPSIVGTFGVVSRSCGPVSAARTALMCRYERSEAWAREPTTSTRSGVEIRATGAQAAST